MAGGHENNVGWATRFRGRVSTGVLAAALVFAGSACVSTQEDASRNPASPNDEFAVIDELRSDLREWNRQSAKFVDAYLDDTVGADEFVIISTTAIEEMEVVLRRMRDRDLSALPADVSVPVGDVLASYDDKLSAINRITTSVDVGDAGGEEAGVEALQRANSDASSAACAFLDALVAAGADGDASEFGC